MKGLLKNINLRFILVRIVRFILTFFIVLTVIFILPRVAPGDPITNILGLDAGTTTPGEIEYLKHLYGLDKSTLDQYVIFLKSIFTFDFGYSIGEQRVVADIIREGVIASFTVLTPALIIGAFMALAVGLHCGNNKGKPLDKTVTTFAVIIYALPSFLIGILILTIFAFHLNWFPLGHMSSGGGKDGFFDTVYHLTLPVATLSLLIFSGYYIIIRNAVLQTKNEYFIVAKEAHGFSEDYINSNHIARNISTQFVSMFALSIGGIISGALIIEIVFSLPGMGSILFRAISLEDYPVIQGCFIFITMFVLFMNLVAEVLYSILDPRVSDGAGLE